ncbi:UNVERIFIED_CONTAM: hypothetical protein FKN15_069677 [Acipenser sinensis]
MVTFLVENGAIINQPDNEGWIPLHAAASCGYLDIAELLIQAGYDVNIKDYDGWTPLHAASHWGKEEACRVLVENLCDMDTVNKVGQTAFDVADEDVLGYLEELQKKQKLLLSEKQDKKSPLIETTTTTENNQSLKPVKNKETLLTEKEKRMPRIESLEQEKADEEEEGKKDESSCSSEEEEEEDSESETEAEKSKTSEPTNSTATQPSSVTVSSPTIPTNQVTPTSPVKKFAPPAGKVSPKEEERKDESPASWRSGLRKTGSYGALAEITAAKEAQKEKESTGVMRSASSPRLSFTLDNKNFFANLPDPRYDSGLSSMAIDRYDHLIGRSNSEGRKPYSSRLEREDTADYKKERRVLERRISEMEEELKNLRQVKQIQTLRQLNERLVAENRALTRVVAKLSESCSQLQAVDL